MIELASVLFIILLFIFPLPALATSLGLFTAWNLYRKWESFNIQPMEGKKCLALGMALFLVNFICSILLATVLAFVVYSSIYENFYLLIFNFIFCFAISLRWFDFTYNIYRIFINKLNPYINKASANFVVCQGFRERDHGGFGLAPVYTDAGAIEIEEHKISFKGVFSEENITTANILHAEKRSSDKIKVLLRPRNLYSASVLLITLKERFYPFKSRSSRDNIHKHLLKLSSTT